MVSHAMWKTWPEGLSRQKPRPKAEIFVVTEARGPCFLQTEHQMVNCQKKTAWSNTPRPGVYRLVANTRTSHQSLKLALKITIISQSHASGQWVNSGKFAALRVRITLQRADSRFAPSQWETALLCNDFSHWLVANPESALLHCYKQEACRPIQPADYWNYDRSCNHNLVINQSFSQSVIIHDLPLSIMMTCHYHHLW